MFTRGSLKRSNPYSRADLEKWRIGGEWQAAASGWLEELAHLHGKENFRTRKGSANPDVKEICEEVLPLGIWMKSCGEMSGWEARFTQRGSVADALLRKSESSPMVSLQIVGAFDGAEMAAQMRELNAQGSSSVRVQAKSDISEKQTQLVTDRIRHKAALGYPKGFWLLVAIDDLFVRMSCLPEVIAHAREAGQQTEFAQVHLVGVNGKETIRVH